MATRAIDFEALHANEPPHLAAARDAGLCDAARRVRHDRPRAVAERHALAVFRAAARRGPGPLPRQRALRAVLVGDALRRHHGGRHRPRALLVRRAPRRHHREGHGPGFHPADVHRDGSAQARRPAQGGVADRLAGQPRQARGADPRARAEDLRRAAGRRDVRLGRPRLDRADDADARDAVRLPVGGPPPADLLVRHGDRRRDGAGQPDQGRARGDHARMPDVFHRLWNERVNAEPRGTTSCRCSRTTRRRATWCRWNISATCSC